MAAVTDKVDIRNSSPGAAPEPTAKSKAAKPAKKRKGRSKAAPVIVLLAVLAAVAAVLALDAFGLRSGYVIPALRKIPIARNLLPPETSETETPSGAELSARINDLTGQLLQSQKAAQSLMESNGALRAENERLKSFEERQERFKSDKADFDRMIAMHDPQAYADFYAEVSPENAERLYGEAVELARRSAEEKQYAKLIAGMDSGAAAAALETLIPTDIDLVVGVLRNMESAAASAILDEMRTQNAAIAAKMLASGTPAG